MANILTDTIFQTYNGDMVDSTNPTQREIAYDIAEEMVSDYLDTPLAPSTVSGVYALPYDLGNILLEHTYLNGIDQIGYRYCETDYVITGTYLGNYYSEHGVVPTALFYGNLVGWPDGGHLIITYNTGLPTGTFSNNRYMLGLTKYAQIIMYEMFDPSSLEGGEGDIGIKSFGDNGYAEDRKPFISTLLGNSNRVQLIRRLFSKLRKYRGVSM